MALHSLAMTAPESYLSIKAPSLKFSSALLSEVVQSAQTAGIKIHFDSLSPDVADATWTLIARARNQHSKVGCTAPARGRRSSWDVERAIGLGLSVRIVKGQWPDSECPETEVQSRFIALVEQLAGRARLVAVATHDERLARETLTRLKQAGTPCELELLMGLPTKIPIGVARDLGVPLRMYVPYGHAYLPYALSHVRKNPRVLWWATRAWLAALFLS